MEATIVPAASNWVDVISIFELSKRGGKSIELASFFAVIVKVIKEVT